MPKRFLDDLPLPNPKLLRQKIKSNLEEALGSLDKFSDSIRDWRAPAWPPEATYELFMAQLDAFRCISKRSENASAIQLMREIDRTWHKLRVVGTVARCVEHLQSYLRENLLGSVIGKALFELRQEPANDELISPVRKTRLAGPADLRVMSDIQNIYDGLFYRSISSELLKPAGSVAKVIAWRALVYEIEAKSSDLKSVGRWRQLSDRVIRPVFWLDAN
jgi:hypothetical protein